MPHAPALDWSTIDTVLLDMDGTLLDLEFDNWFWQSLVPQAYAGSQGVSVQAAELALAPKFRAVAGTLRWYCIEYWSDELGLDIAAIKRGASARVRYLPGAQEFLVKLAANGKRRILVTNAHPIALAIKSDQVALEQHFDVSYSSHSFLVAKEDLQFWSRLMAAESFDPKRTLFVDDSLAVLSAARNFGIAHIRAVRRPDSVRPSQQTPGYSSVESVVDLL